MFMFASNVARVFLVLVIILTATSHAHAHSDAVKINAVANVNTIMVEGGKGVPIALTRWGNPDGPGMLLIHGFMSSTINWQKQINSSLGQHFNMAAIDIRGHGSSAKPWLSEDYTDTKLSAEDIAAVIEAAGLQNPVLVAWSYGGLFAMDYVRHYGTENIAGIVIVDGTGGLVAPPPRTKDSPEKAERVERSRSANIQTILDWTNGFMSYMTSDGELPADELQKVQVSAMLVPHYVRRHLREKSTDNSDLVEKLDKPVLFVVGSLNKTALKHTKTLSKKMSDAELKVYDNRLTMTMWYEADRFNKDISKFAKSAQ